MPVRHRDGSTVDAVVTAHPLHGPDGRPLGHAVTVQRWGRRPVIADRAFEQCPFALGVYDPDLRFLWINASSGRVIAHSEEQVVGKKYREVLPEFDRSLFPERDDKPYTDKLAEVARTGVPARLITVFHPRGSNYANAWATSIWPVRDAEGQVRAVANWGFDMSAEYWARQRLLILNKASGGIGRTLDVIGTAQELATTSVPGFADLVTRRISSTRCCAERNHPPWPRSPPARPSCSAVPPGTARRRTPTGLPGPRRRSRHPPDSVAARCMATGRSTVQLAAEPGQGGEWAFGPGTRRRPGPLAAGQPVDRRVPRRGRGDRPDHRAAPGPRRAARRRRVRPQRPARDASPPTT